LEERFADGLGDIRVPQANDFAEETLESSSANQMLKDDACVDDYNDDLLDRLREEDAAVDNYNDDLLDQLYKDDDW
jgi:hypothetical protein